MKKIFYYILSFLIGMQSVAIGIANGADLPIFYPGQPLLSEDLNTIVNSLSGKIDLTQKGQALGVATLGSDGIVPMAQLPDFYNIFSGSFIPLNQKAQPLGVATLGSDGKVLPSQLPTSSITESNYLHTFGNETATGVKSFIDGVKGFGLSQFGVNNNGTYGFQVSNGSNGSSSSQITFGTPGSANQNDRWQWWVNGSESAAGLGTRTMQLWYYPYDNINGCCQNILSFQPKNYNGGSSYANQTSFNTTVAIGGTNASSLNGPTQWTGDNLFVNSYWYDAGSVGTRHGGLTISADAPTIRLLDNNGSVNAFIHNNEWVGLGFGFENKTTGAMDWSNSISNLGRLNALNGVWLVNSNYWDRAGNEAEGIKHAQVNGTWGMQFYKNTKDYDWYQFNKGTLSNPQGAALRIGKDGLYVGLETDWVTDSRASFMIGNRYSRCGTAHSAGGHEALITWGDLTSNPCGSATDGGWGLIFGSVGSQFLKLSGTNVNIGGGQKTVQLQPTQTTPITAGMVLMSKDSNGTAEWTSTAKITSVCINTSEIGDDGESCALTRLADGRAGEQGNLIAGSTQGLVFPKKSISGNWTCPQVIAGHINTRGFLIEDTKQPFYIKETGGGQIIGNIGGYYVYLGQIKSGGAMCFYDFSVIRYGNVSCYYEGGSPTFGKYEWNGTSYVRTATVYGGGGGYQATGSPYVTSYCGGGGLGVSGWQMPGQWGVGISNWNYKQGNNAVLASYGSAYDWTTMFVTRAANYY